MINKVIKLKDGLEYYVIDQIIEDKKIYLFAVQVDNYSLDVIDKCVVCEVKFKDDGLVVDNVSDTNEQEKINNIFISRMKYEN